MLGALERIEPTHSCYCDTLVNLATAYVHVEGFAEGCRYAREALPIGRRWEDGDVISRIGALQGRLLQLAGNTPDVQALGEQLREP
jgi:hypothetical protein